MQLESLIYILYTYLITIYMYKSNKYLNFHGCGKKNHYYNNHLCVYPIILYKKVTYISIHMGTKKTKKITIIIFNLSSQSAKAIMISRDWSFACFPIMPILTRSTATRCALTLSTKRNSYFPLFLSSDLFQVVTQFGYECDKVLSSLSYFQLDKYTLNIYEDNSALVVKYREHKV